MKELKKTIRNNKFLKLFYQKIMNPYISLVRKQTEINDRKILFISFGGEKFDDSPRVIYEEMLNDSRFNNFEMVWALGNNNVSHKTIEKIKKRCTIVSPNSFDYFKELFSARIWITNVSVKRGLNFNCKGHIYINTWHGTPLKYIGNDVIQKKNDHKEEIYYLSQSPYELSIFPRAFNVSPNKILSIGLPRNESLLNSSDIDLKAVKASIGIEQTKEVILYAPTWRENIDLNPYLDLNKLSNNLNNNQILLYRGHHAMSKTTSNERNKYIDVSTYENLNELLLISDVLITDYSSVMVDYSLLKKPIVLYIKDYDNYQKERGLYFDIQEEFNSIVYKNQEDLEFYLKYYKYRDSQDKVINEKFKCINKEPSKRILDLIIKKV